MNKLDANSNLEEAAWAYYDKNKPLIPHELDLHKELISFFIGGAQWQKERILNNAVEREVKVDAGGYPYIDATELYDYDKDKPLAKKGDKVKLIIIMEE